MGAEHRRHTHHQPLPAPLIAHGARSLMAGEWSADGLLCGDVRQPGFRDRRDCRVHDVSRCGTHDVGAGSWARGALAACQVLCARCGFVAQWCAGLVEVG